MYFYKKETSQKGFTLIEMIVVVAIIGILTTIVLAALNQARAKARDADRYADLKQVQLALEIYRDVHGEYPITTSSGVDFWSVCDGEHTNTGEDGYIPGLAPQYIPVLPIEELGCPEQGAVGGYIYSSNGTDYKFAADYTAEIGAQCKAGGEFEDPDRVLEESDWHFCSVYTPGAANW